MRITNNMLVGNMINNISRNLGRMDKFQQQLSTGKKILVPSDDPVVAARALKLRTDVAEVEQYKRNAEDAQSWIDATETALANIGDVLHKVRELAVQASNGPVTPNDAQKIQQEVKQLKAQAVHISNTTYSGRYIFSGYKTDSKLINDNEASPDFGKFSMDVLNSESIRFEIGIGDDININVTGGDLFNGGADAAAGNVPKFIETIDKFITALGTGDHKVSSELIDEFDGQMDNVLRVRADIGARSNRVDLTVNRLNNDYINFTKLMSQNEDVDQAETIMNLKNEENVYRASLAGGARIIQPTLVDFLR